MVCQNGRRSWKNLKSRAKGDVAEIRKSSKRTGGGPADAARLDPLSEKICSILPQQIQSFTNRYDDDTEFHMDTQVCQY